MLNQSINQNQSYTILSSFHQLTTTILSFSSTPQSHSH